MSKATQYNRFSHKFVAEIKDLKFKKLEELYKEDSKGIYQVTGLFINRKSKFGDKPFLSTPFFLVDLPKNRLDDIQNMINDQEVVDDVNSGLVGFKVVSYFSKTYNKTCYNIEFVDMDAQVSLTEEDNF